MLLDELDLPLDDVVVVDRLAIADFNESNILPQDEATLTRIRDWLRPTKYEEDGSELKKHTGSHLEGTSQWLFDSPIFQQWHHGRDDGILWIRGVPGTGKSVLASRLIHQLSSEQCPILYFFFRHTIQSNHRPESALRDWLAQALPFSPPLQLALKSLIFRPICLDFVDDLSLVELWHLVRLALRGMAKVYCVVDALDEMDTNTLETFLQLIDQLGNMHPDRIKLIITSRPIPTIEKMVRNLRLLDIRLDKKAINPDILTYLEHRLAASKLSPEARVAVKDAVFQKAEGLFLYAKLTMDKIAGLQNESEAGILESIDKMPVNLSVMYKNLLREHMDRTGLPEGLQMLVLKLVTHATRPLRLLEISDCIKVTQPQYGQDTGAIKNHVRTCCGPLLEILPDETVRVVHHSLTEYLFGLTRSSDDNEIPVIEPGPTHNLLANLCVSYLQSGHLDKIKFKDYGRSIKISEAMNQDWPPFMNYAIHNWHVHTRASTRRGVPQYETNDKIFSMLMIPKHVALLATLSEKPHYANMSHACRDPETPLETEVLTFSIKLGLHSFIDSLLERCGGDALGFHGWVETEPPLHQAVEDGSLDIIRSLIKHGAELDEHNRQGCTPLHKALGVCIPPHKALWGGARTKGYPCAAIVESLLEAGADPWNTQEESERGCTMASPIQEVFRKCDKTVAKLFLPYIKTQKEAKMAMDWVINGSKDLEVLRLILDLGLADINDNADSPTPLFYACQQVDPMIVSMLLEAGASPNICQWVPGPPECYDLQGRLVVESLSQHSEPGPRDGDAGPNALHALAEPGYSLEDPPDEAIRECFRLLVDAGADVNHVDSSGYTPLHHAKSPLMAELLLEAGADTTAINHYNQTPLHSSHDVEVMKMILNKTDINIRGRDSKIVFFRLLEETYARRGREVSPLETALQLLDLGVDAQGVDSEGNTALHHLASTERGITSPEGMRLVERLMQEGLDPNLHNGKGEAAVHRLAAKEITSGPVSPACLRTFISLTKADINAVDSKGQTLLFSSIDSFNSNLQKLMWICVGQARIASSNDMTSTDTENDGSFISVMADLGARFDVVDQKGRTLLHAAVGNCRDGKDVNVLRRLVELGADPQKTDLEGNTIWHEVIPKCAKKAYEYRSHSPSLETLQSITAMGIDPRQASNQGTTPFHILCEYNQPASNPVLFEYLLQQIGGDVNMKDYNEVTALHTVSTYSGDFTRRLLELGADATLVTKEGINVFHLAARCRQSNTIGLVLEWLRERIAKEELQSLLNLKDSRGRAPLYYACASGCFRSVELLISAGAVVDMDTYEGSTLSGCAYIEEEAKNWPTVRSPAYITRSGGVLIDDTKRPNHVLIEGRLQEVLDLVIDNAAALNWSLLDMAIAAAVEKATVENLHPREKSGHLYPPVRDYTYHPDHDYTVECLVQARKVLGVRGELPCAPELQQCLQRRQEVLKDVSVEKECNCGTCYKFPWHIWLLKKLKCYDAIPNYLNKVSPKPEDLHSVLVNLAREGMARLLNTLLTPETISSLGRTKDESLSPLMHAACESTEPNMPVIRLLVSMGVELDKAKPQECSFLHVLSRGGQHPWWHTGEALPYMIKQGVCLENRDKDGLTPLNASLDEIDNPAWSPKIPEMLLQAGADPSSVDDKGKSCLWRAIGNKTVFKMLAHHGAIIDPTLLTSAILTKDIGMVEMILSSGADPNVRGPPSHSPDKERRRRRRGVYTPAPSHEIYPLDLAINRINRVTGAEVESEPIIRMIEMLLEFGADPNARFDHTTVAHKILGKDGDSSLPMPLRRFAYPRAPYSVRRKYLDLIFQHPTLNVNLRDTAGVPLLHVAFDEADEETAQILMNRGANVSARDDFDRNILHIGSALLCKKDLFDDIIARAPELLDQANKCGRTPLHCALGDRDEFGYLRSLEKAETFIQMLLAAGANVCAKDENGDTPLHLLLQRKWNLLVNDDGSEVWQGPIHPIMEILLSKGADINARNKTGETPIFAFFREGDLHVDVGTDSSDDELPAPCTIHSRSKRQVIQENRSVLWALFDKAGVDWTAISAKGQSLLHVVAGHKGQGCCFTRLERFEFLMGKGLDPLAEDREHRTALDIAAANGANEIIELFKTE
ncbi:hypothetical protein FGADI_3323 [Fusarium gaditjirri]|uniref:NACHT domain-containing protein n=1 Tax=Fusarium gaditjirri TaxID=282569 RepID=A0A8H4TG15_9HYPO|nr:hypothetical protein FGADI_3323 [Fusarium gaditjirri]